MKPRVSESKIRRIQKLAAQGFSLKENAKAAGVSIGSVRRYSKNEMSPVKAGRVVALPTETRTANVVMFFGSPEAVAQAARNML
jgi:predicted transcriptional regulator